MPANPPDLTAFFTPGYRVASGFGETATVTAVAAAGELSLPSGRVIACDPLVGLEDEELAPFTVAVPPGRYPVSASVTTITRDEDEDADEDADDSRSDGKGDGGDGRPHLRTAAARLVVRDAVPVAWEMAVTPGQDVAKLADDEVFAYPVDTATGCFLDQAAVPAFRALLDADPDALQETLEGAGWDRPAIVTEPAAGHELAVFLSGWGDGAYPTWIGRDASGEVAWLVTDFFVLAGDD